ncbi:hypothetical protein ACVIGB_000810 [Bradyrhizobium sp. USDA 4341]
MKKFLDFAKNGVTVHFPSGVTNDSIPNSRLGKLATVLSVVGSVAIVTPSTAEARGGGAIMGLIGGMMIGSMMARNGGAIAAPMYQSPTYAAPVQPYYGSYGTQGYGVSPGYGGYGSQGYGVQGGGQPGNYYCPRGPQHRCFWRGSQLEIQDDLKKAAKMETDEAPAPRMG